MVNSKYVLKNGEFLMFQLKNFEFYHFFNRILTQKA